MSKQTFVIVGAGLAGAKAAQELRDRGFDGKIVVIGTEPERPYERPPLSKELLRGESERSKVFVHEDSFYEQHEIELISARRACTLDVRSAQVKLDDGRALAYDKLLLTTGAEPRRLRVPGAELDGVYYLRTLEDCEALRGRLDQGDRLAVIGAGWIGSEVAASARQKGLEVTLIDPLALPNERIFGSEMGAFYRDVHAQHGVTMALGEGVEALEGDGHVSGIRTSRGRVIECDFAVVGIGVLPRVDLARDAGLAVDNGIVVDERLRTSVPNVFAAGDVANAWHPLYGRQIRVEHWANALNQGPAAARSMLGDSVSYDRVPYFFSDQYDVGMEYSGYVTQWDQVVIRGDREAAELIAFWLKDDRVLAAMNVNVWDVTDHLQALVRSGHPVDVAALRDPDIPLASLSAATPAQSI